MYQEANMTQSRRRIIPVVAALLGVAMMATGTVKLAGEAHQVAAFATWDVSPWFRALVSTSGAWHPSAAR
jgi:hypothetical protein